MSQLTIRGFEPELEQRLRETARREGVSLSARWTVWSGFAPETDRPFLQVVDHYQGMRDDRPEA